MQLVGALAGGHPVAVAPHVRGLGHHRRRPWLLLGGEGDRVGFQGQVTGGGQDLVLVAGARTHAGHEDLPDTGRAERPHGMDAAVPLVEVADHPDRPGVGRPHREGGAGHALMLAHVRAQHPVEVAVPALAQQVEVEVAERRPEPVGVVVDVGGRAVVARLQPVGGRRLGGDVGGEHPSVGDAPHVDRLAAGQEHTHGGGAGPEGANGAVVGAEDLVRVGQLASRHTLDGYSDRVGVPRTRCHGVVLTHFLPTDGRSPTSGSGASRGDGRVRTEPRRRPCPARRRRGRW